MSESKPKIGITLGRMPADPTADWRLQAYLSALRMAGAYPVLLASTMNRPDFDRAATDLHGYLFAGGGDVDPRFYGETPTIGLQLDHADRDERELELARRAVEEGRPLLAICRGLQVFNVALGGNLIQDILRDFPNSAKHGTLDGDSPTTHAVEVDPSSRLHELLGGGDRTVNSYHHQAALRLGAGLVATAHAPDGIIEALELPAHPFAIAVQWHPERMASDPAMASLFRAFVTAAQVAHDG